MSAFLFAYGSVTLSRRKLGLLFRSVFATRYYYNFLRNNVSCHCVHTVWQAYLDSLFRRSVTRNDALLATDECIGIIFFPKNVTCSKISFVKS